jgi:hypothetical protein
MDLTSPAASGATTDVGAANGIPPDGSALEVALRLRNEGIVRLLLQYGADARSVPFAEVVDTSSPVLIRMFIELGADLFTGFPIAKGLIRATRLFLGIYKTYIEKYPQLQFQADVALRHLCADPSPAPSHQRSA